MYTSRSKRKLSFIVSCNFLHKPLQFISNLAVWRTIWRLQHLKYKRAESSVEGSPSVITQKLYPPGYYRKPKNHTLPSDHLLWRNKTSSTEILAVTGWHKMKKEKVLSSYRHSVRGSFRDKMHCSWHIYLCHSTSSQYLKRISLHYNPDLWLPYVPVMHYWNNAHQQFYLQLSKFILYESLPCDSASSFGFIT